MASSYESLGYIYHNGQWYKKDGRLAFPAESRLYVMTQGKILSACAAGTTVSQAGTVVTVVNGGAAPAAHNIPATTFDGYSVYFPGSPSIPAGWYSGFARTTTTAYTFTRAAATVASESVNGAAAYTAETLVDSVAIAGGLLDVDSGLCCLMVGACNGTAGTKSVLSKIGTTQTHYLSATSSLSMQGETEWRNRGVANSQVSHRSYGANANLPFYTTVDTAADFTWSFYAQAAVANDYVTVDMCRLKLAP